AVVVGAGVVGAACAYYLSRAGLRVTVLDRGPVAGGATGAGEGSLRFSGRAPGPQAELARASMRRWREIGAALGAESINLETSGSLVVAATAAERDEVAAQVAAQRQAGGEASELDAEALLAREPRLAAKLAGGAYFPEDARL